MRNFFIGLCLATASLSSMAATEKIYNCEATNEYIGKTYKDAKVTFTKGFGGLISAARIEIRSGKRIVLQTFFRGPQKAARTSKEMYMDGILNKRLNPFADGEYLYFVDQYRELFFNDLYPTMQFRFSENKGPIGNRGGDVISFDCQS